MGADAVLSGMICPKCGKPAWAPCVMTVTKKFGPVHSYLVYRHPHGIKRPFKLERPPQS